MREFVQQPGQRPADYRDTLQHFKNITTLSRDSSAIHDLNEMARGGNPTGGDPDPGFEGIREKYYQGWKDEDFRALLSDLGFPIKE